MIEKKLLFVHPDYKLSGIYAKHLGTRFNVDSAHDGLTAIRRFRANPPSIVVSDYELPLLSGISFLRFVRQHPIHQAVPFIFLTTYHDNSEALGLGASDWLDTRNCSPDFLLDRIHKIHQMHAV
ncbi:MAG: hypothetical protein A3I07_01310 [Candidatus Doudnabacteria bacterium RIFCSPLOWO2_02_FULL_42_9]|uniref:Response regulatory domain-containing protein n=1 Tax=Candidatus Doudnabacteria bacterium RIFCSPHIGHO2_01_FULL_41_86 TaxID=1817821 RepID=A0A1F5N8W4_9BACT|nr:MAG: hypothetical protein A2717_00870 [Candidatus Doudnabacteria bacterium RIFCSPHIGHO2_01_FULL_41_86]OGE75395.1 MAG: hypothetical protein A3K07_01385 [Candidatus Doudnabacteria bacterium RIFCSPHIGHO2_01_43_10]OGE86579.1 MAG: hypothetical protein A3E28_04185 [Candidatus Doudnabacteria bacterium RIFCSPHIGHO2_12_FULL_42_22]OGE87479.1 MAG: hypothetical protein A3C49_03845 [Candidatus Doudnabacteria bacterium RIFCSPHIGHO2_02_FULL_42_25]OGE92786.1 MAG: hypothetical protein A2895_04670 [Candidatus